MSHKVESPESERQPSRWRNYLAETVVIMISILVALLVDAWWDDYQDRQHEIDYLGDLREEFGYARAELGRDQDRRRDMMEALRAFLDDETSANARLLNEMLDYRAFNPSHPVLEDLVGSGNFRLLEDNRLRLALLRYQQDVDRLNVGELRDREFVSDRVEPFLLNHVRLEAHFGGRLPGRGDALTDDLSPLNNNDTFRNLALLRWNRLETSVRFGEYVDESIERVLSRIDAPAATSENTATED